jgi:hypothetical protein
MIHGLLATALVVAVLGGTGRTLPYFYYATETWRSSFEYCDETDLEVHRRECGSVPITGG